MNNTIDPVTCARYQPDGIRLWTDQKYHDENLPSKLLTCELKHYHQLISLTEKGSPMLHNITPNNIMLSCIVRFTYGLQGEGLNEQLNCWRVKT